MQGGSRDLQPTEAKAEPPEQFQPIPRFVRSKDFIAVYANHVFFSGTTIWDMRISFGEVQGVNVDRKELVVEDRVAVTMPLQVAKVLALSIEANLQQYEKQTGKAVALPEIGMTKISIGPDGMITERHKPEPK
jgi:hypothetical protein